MFLKSVRAFCSSWLRPILENDCVIARTVFLWHRHCFDPVATSVELHTLQACVADTCIGIPLAFSPSSFPCFSYLCSLLLPRPPPAVDLLSPNSHTSTSTSTYLPLHPHTNPLSSLARALCALPSRSAELPWWCWSRDQSWLYQVSYLSTYPACVF